MGTESLGTNRPAEVVAEDPSVVKGGPLDPTSAEGQPPEGHVVGVPSAPSVPEEPLYQGLTGAIKTQDELKSYTKQLEDMFVQAKAAQTFQAAPASPAIPAAPAGPTAKQKFSELIYSKPDEAFELAVQESMDRINAKKVEGEETQRRENAFWAKFYEKNSDLKRLEHIVQSVVSGKRQDLATFRTVEEVESFISKETRKIVDLVKSAGGTETVVSSGRAVTLGASGEPVPMPAAKPAAPLNFTDQIRRLRPMRK